MGVDKTMAAIRRNFAWTNMRADISEFISQCDSCLKRKTDPSKSTKEPLGAFPEAKKPFSRVHCDILGQLPTTEKGNRYLFTMVDAYSKYFLAVPISQQTAPIIASALIDHLVLKFGAPETLVTDQGANLKSKIFQETLQILGTDHHILAPYAHFSNGQIERMHRTLEEALSSYVNKSQNDWDTIINHILFAINNAPTATSGLSPFEVIFGWQPKTPEDVQLKTPYIDDQDFVANLKRNRIFIRNQQEERQRKAQEARKEQYDEKHNVKEKELQIGDLIYVERGPAVNKLAPRRHGPYQIIRVEGKNVFYLDNGSTRKCHKNNAIKKL